jgi:hypothetical protein
MNLGIKWGLVDVLLLLGLYGVYLDRLWRASCEAPGQCLSQVSSISLSPFTLVTSLGSNGVPLQSPLTLDWIQLILISLVVVNTYFAYIWLRRRTIPSVI